MRTLVDIPSDDVDRLDALAAKTKRSRAAVIREAVRLHLLNQGGSDWIDRGFGLWKDRDDIGDGLEYQERIRAEWDREWDPD